MSDELTNELKYKADPASRSVDALERISLQIVDLNQKIKELVDHKETQLEQDTMWRNRWLHAKKIGARWTLATVFLAIAGVSVAGASFVLDLRSDGVVVEDKVKAYLHSEWDFKL